MTTNYVTLHRLNILNPFAEKKIKETFLDLSKIKTSKFYKDTEITFFCLFQLNLNFFFLFIGNKFLNNNWDRPMKDTSENFIINNLLFTQFELIDLTYLDTSKIKNSRRLRSLGGALRRIFSNIREAKNKPNTVSSNNEIIKELKYYLILGNEEELEITKRAVLTNKKITRNSSTFLNKQNNLSKNQKSLNNDYQENIDAFNQILKNPQEFQENFKQKSEKEKEGFLQIIKEAKIYA
jgi:hypothetical protein